MTCHLVPSLGNDETEWACVGQTGMGFGSMWADLASGEETLLPYSAMTLMVMCHLEVSAFNLGVQGLNMRQGNTVLEYGA